MAARYTWARSSAAWNEAAELRATMKLLNLFIKVRRIAMRHEMILSDQVVVVWTHGPPCSYPQIQIL